MWRSFMLVVWIACTSTPPELAPTAALAPPLRVEAGLDVAPNVVSLVRQRLAPFITTPLTLVLGDHPLARQLISDDELATLGPEGFVVRAQSGPEGLVVAARGNAFDDAAPTKAQGALGNGFAAYAALEAMGFAFLHPLAPRAPDALRLPAPGFELKERRALRIRSFQLHTMHPIELTNVLNGWGPHDTSREGWTELLPEWDRYLEWMLANRQNHVHWVLLHDTSARWGEFGDSGERQARLGELVARAHAMGVRVGVDAPVALAQHARTAATHGLPHGRRLRLPGNRERHQRVYRACG